MTKILFYSAIPTVSRDQLSLMQAFLQRGHTVIFLNRSKSLAFRKMVTDIGVVYYEYESNQIFSFLYLVILCFQKDIKFVYSHLEPANFLAVVAQFFISSKVIICRHHVDEARLYHFDKSIAYRLTYKFAPHIVVVSERAKKYMVEKEGVSEYKISHINLTYDFSWYDLPEKENVIRIRNQFEAEVLLVTVCRLTEFKRPQQAIILLQKLMKAGINAKLIILGKGELEGELKDMIHTSSLENSVYMLGHVGNVLDYLAAADFLVHPSVLESSCVTIKEAGLVEKSVIACNDVGDFNELIESGVNGFLVNKDNFVEEAFIHIKNCYTQKEVLVQMGRQLNSSIMEKFHVSRIIHQYDSLIPV